MEHFELYCGQWKNGTCNFSAGVNLMRAVISAMVQFLDVN